MRIDVHAHYWTDDYLDLLVDLGHTDTGTQRGLGAGGGEELEARLRLMHRAGVDMQVLSACPQLPYGKDRDKAVAAALIGAPIEDTISIMQLITAGIPSRYPRIKIINSHLGGALPMLVQRADDQYRWEAPETPERPALLVHWSPGISSPS